MGVRIGVISSGERIEKILFTKLSDEEDPSSWDKRTIEYVIENRDKIIREIINSSKKCVSGAIDVDDLYQMVLLYFYGHRDYDFNIALERCQEEKEPASIEAYVSKCVECVVKNYYTNMKKRNSKIVNCEIEHEDGRTTNLIDIYGYHEDDFAEKLYMFDDLESACEMYESKRYFLGYDVFTLVYIQILKAKYDIHGVAEDKIRNLYKVASININDTAKETDAQSEFRTTMALALSKCMFSEKGGFIAGCEKAISIVKKYVYGADKIEGAVKYIALEAGHAV